MIPDAASHDLSSCMFDDLRGAERGLKKALTVVDWNKVPVVFTREEAKIVLELISEEVRDRGRTTMISEEVITGVDYGRDESSQV